MKRAVGTSERSPGYGRLPALPPAPGKNGPSPRAGKAGCGAPPRATTGPGGYAGAPAARPAPMLRPDGLVVARYAMTAVSCCDVKSETGRINPRPPVTTARIASSDNRAVTPTSDGAPGIAPCRFAPWHTRQFC